MFGLLLATPAMLFDAPLPIVQAPTAVSAVRYHATAKALVDNTHNGLFPPTTFLLASSNMVGTTDRGDVYQGGVGALDLASLLDEVPVSDLDTKGEEGIKADLDGVKRLKERQSKEEEAAKQKYLDTVAIEKMHEELIGIKK